MHIKINSHSIDRYQLAYYLAIFSYSAWLIFAAQNLAFYNQGDFHRAIGSILETPIDLQSTNQSPAFHFLWTFSSNLGSIKGISNSSTLIFFLAAIGQKWYSSHFNLFGLSLLAQCALLIISVLLTQRITVQYSLGRMIQCLMFIIISSMIFASHNIALLNTFYQEYAFFIFFPLVLLSLLHLYGNKNSLWVVISTLACGLAKVQFFYFPTLVIVTILLIDQLNKKTIRKFLLIPLLVVQVICVIPLLLNVHQQANYFHSTRFGSYLVMTEKELTQTNLPIDQRECIGTDLWHNKINGAEDLHTYPVKTNCLPSTPIKTHDVLKPYIDNPTLIFRLLSKIAPEHFSVNYFHVAIKNTYLIPTTNSGFKSGKYLIQLSQLRNKLLTKYVLAITVIVGLALPLINIRRPIFPELSTVAGFCALFAISQVIICLLGEGIRDLGKHLSMAQYAIDFLVLVLALNLCLHYRHWRNNH